MTTVRGPWCGGRRAVGFALMALLAEAHTLSGQDAIAADRPGLDFNPRTVDPGIVQMEIGFPTVSYLGGSQAETWVLSSPTLVRVGVAPDFELRAQLSPFNSLSSDLGSPGMSSTERGVGDLELGAKVRLTDGSDGPAIALIPSITVPTGEEPFTTDGVGYLLNGIASLPLGESAAIAAVGGIYHVSAGDDGADTSGLLALVLSRSLSGVVGSFVELGWLPTEGSSDPVLLGGGLAFLVSTDIQLDLYVDRGLTVGGPDWQFGGGVALRFR